MTIELKGIGLHTGREVNIKLIEKTTRGIIFIRSDLNNKKITAILDNAIPVSNYTLLKRNNIEVLTTEHLLAACYSLDISNLIVILDNNELPVFDGSSKEYINILNKFKRMRFFTKNLKKGVFVRNNDKLLIALPSPYLRITYFLSHENKLIGNQLLSIKITKENFINEIAEARTFATYSEAIELRKKGLAQGGSFNNTIVFSKNKIFTKLRFKDEPVRHKILDLLGNLCLLNFRLNAHIIGIRSGHELNIKLLKEIINKKLMY